MSLLTATADVDISASPEQVWHALTDPDIIEKYFFGSRVETTWEPGTPISWTGEYEGRRYQDTGEVIDAVPGRRLRVTHLGMDDRPEHQHQLTWELRDDGDHTHVHLEQDNNASEDARSEAQANWDMVLRGLKECVERG